MRYTAENLMPAAWVMQFDEQRYTHADCAIEKIVPLTFNSTSFSASWTERISLATGGLEASACAGGHAVRIRCTDNRNS